MCKMILIGITFGAVISVTAAAFGQASATAGTQAVIADPVAIPPGGGGGAAVVRGGLGLPGSEPGPRALFFTGPTDPRGSHEAQLNAKVQEALNQYTAAKDDDAKQAAKKQLQSALTELFDVKQKEREEEIKQIEDRVAKLRETLRKRDSMKQELIEHHLTTLIQDAEGLGWGSDGGPYRASVRATPDGNAFYRIQQPGAVPAPSVSPVPVLPRTR